MTDDKLDKDITKLMNTEMSCAELKTLQDGVRVIKLLHEILSAERIATNVTTDTSMESNITVSIDHLLSDIRKLEQSLNCDVK